MNNKEYVGNYIRGVSGADISDSDFFFPCFDDCRIQREDLFAKLLDSSSKKPIRFADNSGFWINLESPTAPIPTTVSVSGETAIRFEKKYCDKYKLN